MSVGLDNPVFLSKSQVKAASKVLSLALQDYPLHIAFIPDESERKKKSPHFLEVFIRYGMRYGVVYATSPNLEGILIWLPSEHADYGIWKMIRSGMVPCTFKIGIKTVLRMLSIGNYFSKLHNHHAPFRHWYGWYVGVSPEFQGKGYGRILIETMLAKADKDQLPCYGETHTQENVPLWEHYGFKVIDQTIIPGTEFKHWIMLRNKAT
jgi:GNAT superfamily N-acetyltransferase